MTLDTSKLEHGVRLSDVLLISCDLSPWESLRGWSNLDHAIKWCCHVFTFLNSCDEWSVCPSLHTALEIESCDLDIKSNTSSHHTDLCGRERLIVRRGQPFDIILHLKPGSKEFKPYDTSFTLIVETGERLPVMTCLFTVLRAWGFVFLSSEFRFNRFIFNLCLSRSVTQSRIRHQSFFWSAWPRSGRWMERICLSWCLRKHS